MDVVVIGGGAIGCAVAWRLRQRGLEVTLVERGTLAGEATGAAAGILAPQAEAHAPGPLFQLKDRSRRMWPAFVEELQAQSAIDVGYRRTGTLMRAFDESERAALRERFAWQSAAGLRAEWREQGLFLPDDHQVEPRLLGSALGTVALRAGVTLHPGQARRLLHDGARVTGILVDETVLAAPRVVLAAGAWSSLLEGLPPLVRVRPLRGQMLELRAAPELVPHVIFGDGGYLVPRADGRVLCGSSEDDVGFVKAVTPEVLARLCQRAVRLAPGLAGAQVSASWAGFRPTPSDGLPVLGESELRGLYLATGHHRNGILLAPLTAHILAALVTDESSPVDLEAFRPAR